MASPSDSTKSSQQAIRTPLPNHPWAASWAWISATSNASAATCQYGWCSMPPYAPGPQLAETEATASPNVYGP